MVQVEMNNMYVNIGANKAVNTYEQKKPVTSGKLINLLAPELFFF